MEKFNIHENTKIVEGGVIVRKPGTNEPYGLIMEMNYLPIFTAMPKPAIEEQLAQLEDGPSGQKTGTGNLRLIGK